MTGVSPASISALQQASVAQQVQTRVARKALDVTRQQGAAAISLLQDAAQLQQRQVQAMSIEPHKGLALDVIA